MNTTSTCPTVLTETPATGPIHLDKARQGRTIYFAIQRSIKTCTHEEIQREVGFEFPLAQFIEYQDRILQRIKAKKGTTPTPSTLDQPSRSQLLEELNSICLNDGEVVILEDKEIAYEAMQTFIKFIGHVQACGGIRKAIAYLRLMVDLQRTLVK